MSKGCAVDSPQMKKIADNANCAKCDYFCIFSDIDGGDCGALCIETACQWDSELRPMYAAVADPGSQCCGLWRERSNVFWKVAR